jgi:DNA-binding NarL/FixJ family response regulator
VVSAILHTSARTVEDHKYAPAGKLLLLSVHDEPAVVAAAMAAGADGLVLKRATANDLMPTIDALLAGQRYFASKRSSLGQFSWTHCHGSSRQM